MTDTTIKVDTQVRDRLAALAAEQGQTIGGLVAELAEQRPTRAELRSRFEATRAYLETHVLDAPMTDAELAAADQVWRDLAAGRRVESL